MLLARYFGIIGPWIAEVMCVRTQWPVRRPAGGRARPGRRRLPRPGEEWAVECLEWFCGE